MGDWLTRFLTIRPMDSLPRLRVVSTETHAGASYHYEGSRRGAERMLVFQCTISGEGRFKDASGVHRLPPGHGFLCRVSDPETSYFHPGGDAPPWRFMFVTFDGTGATSMVDEIVERYGHVFQIKSECPPIQRLAAWKAYDGAQVRITASDGAIEIFELLAALCESEEPSGAPSPSSRMISDACNLIEARLESGASVGSLARELGISREHLTRLFKEETGETPHHYINRRRLLLACHLLKDSPLSCKDVAGRLGGMTPQQFVRMFKKEFRMTPSQFRKAGVIPLY